MIFFKAKGIVFIFFLTTLGVSGQVADTIKVTQFGVKSNSYLNASKGVRQALEKCKGKQNIVVQLPGGRIDLWPENAVKKEIYISNSTESDTLSKEKNIGFFFDNLKNVTLDGNNTLVVLHGKMVSFALFNCQNIQIKNIQFDYERPTMSEVTILSVSPTVIEMQIHPDSRYFIENDKIGFYGEGWKSNSYHTISLDKEKNLMRYSTFGPFLKSKAIQKENRTVLFEGDFAKENYKVGDVLSIRDTYRDNCGGFITLSKDIVLSNVKMHFMHGLGIVSQFAENITLSKVVVAPREDSGRVIASFADCFHFSGCKGKILVDGCKTSGSHDDPMNVHGTHLKIIEISADKKIKVQFMHHQTYGFEAFFAGDSISFVSPQTLKPIVSGKLKSAKLIGKKVMELVLDGELSNKIKIGDVIENATWTPEVTVRNSWFERTNARGLLLTTRRKILIENNTFFRTGMHAILIANDASSWFESGAVSDVTIRNNTFEECGYNSGTVINIAPENHELVNGFYVHRNIRIENNTFKIFDKLILSARSTDGLFFSNNTINQSDLLPAESNENSFALTACNNAVIKNNKFNTTWKPKIAAFKMTKKQIKTDIKDLNIK
ncbi:right-handed parallel beta-helix repeat-containing protein [Flavobacterium sp. M31R6]|uniref:right-handed parallel beta-helix repeat-containing protein n=1 Tax=Flavobacterium sp. M31R6 TaxID=2739062 RepID=UPI001568B53E|nr:right-handed parallel beta-helix repeat-containing protein [Flavobacterium sp. M31R6]QKJ63406.1 right-handed parallel beta-helix repeat-containing protein [Flavobacterium sp. M31R6]